MRLVRSSLQLRISTLIVVAGVPACSVYTEDLLLEPVSTETDGTDPSPTPASSEPSETPNSPDVTPDPAETTDEQTDVTPPAPPAPGSGPGETDDSGPDSTDPSDPEPSPEPTDPAPVASTGPDEPGPAPSAPVEETDAGPAPSTPTPTVDDNAPSDDPLIDDFDNGNPRLNGGQREGFWFSDGSADGDITPPEDGFLSISGGGRALHVVASGYTGANAWAAFGVNFNGDSPAPPYVQAAQYTGLQFWACTSANSGSSSLFVLIPTTDTSSEHSPDNEDNHYAYPLELTDTWTQYTFEWADFEQTWGTSKPFNDESIIGIQFSLDGEGFDIWLDNLEFTPDDDSSASPPPTGPCPSGADAGAP